jgi:hypothetical protein
VTLYCPNAPLTVAALRWLQTEPRPWCGTKHDKTVDLISVAKRRHLAGRTRSLAHQRARAVGLGNKSLEPRTFATGIYLERIPACVGQDDSPPRARRVERQKQILEAAGVNSGRREVPDNTFRSDVAEVSFEEIFLSEADHAQ